MGHLTKAVTLISALGGLAVFSQAPEFAQQYRQRIGGAVYELKTVVTDFDQDAASSQLSRDQALDRLKSSNEQFAQDRGQSMSGTIDRYQRLDEQMGWLEKSHPFTRPLLVLKNPDGQLVSHAWEIFEPAVPLNAPGALYGGLGALLAIILARLGISGGRRVVKRNKKEDAAQPEVLTADSQIEPDPEDDVSLYPGVRDFDQEHPEQTGQAQHHAKGIPDSMQVSPVGRGRVAYMKADEGGEG